MIWAQIPNSWYYAANGNMPKQLSWADYGVYAFGKKSGLGGLYYSVPKRKEMSQS